MTKIMKTLWDESADLSDEALSTNSSVLSDGYTTGDVKDITETIENGNREANDLDMQDDVP